MNRIINLILLLLFSYLATAQTKQEAIIMNDSAEVFLTNRVDEIRAFYGSQPEKYPDSILLKYNRIINTIEYRKVLIDKYDDLKWRKKHDSIIQLKKTDFKVKPKLSFGLTDNQGFISAQYAFVFNRYRTFDFGIGSGIEYVNRGTALVQLIQMPIYITNNVFLGKFTFLNFDYGLTIPLNGSYQNASNKKIDYSESELNSRFYFDLGLGILNKSNVGIQFNMRNQSLGVPEPLNQRVWMFGFKLSF